MISGFVLELSEKEVLLGVRSVMGRTRFLGVRNGYLCSLIHSRCRRGHYQLVTVLPELRADHRRLGERASRVIIERMGSGGCG